MINVKDFIDEYNSRRESCDYCAYNGIVGGRCNECKNKDWFVDNLDLKSYIIRQVKLKTRESFLRSEKGLELESLVKVCRNDYSNFEDYVKSQKEYLDNLLNDKRLKYRAVQYEFDMTLNKLIESELNNVIPEFNGDHVKC